MSVTLSLPSSIERIERDDKVLFFNPEVPSWLVTNHNGALLLSLCDGANSVSDILSSLLETQGREAYEQGRKFFQEAIASRLFEVPLDSELPIMEEHQHLSNVQLSVSSKCNLHCKYCYATDREEGDHANLSLEEYQKLVDDLLDFSGGTLAFTLTGGEPLLNKDVFYIAHYIHSKGCNVDLLTNGTLVNEANIHDISESFDGVSISIDGKDAVSHDRFRGSGSYVKTEKCIELLKENGIPYRLSMTVNRLNIEDVEAMAKKYGSHMNFAPLFPAGSANSSDVDMSISGKEYFECLKKASGVNPLSY